MESVASNTSWQLASDCSMLMLAAVYKGTYNNQDVAVKALKDDSKAAQGFLAEASVMT